MKFLGNLIWFIFGGIFVALEYVVASIPFFLSIIGIPFGIQALKMASLALWPFGKKIVERETQSGCLFTLMNIIWFFIGGIWIWLTHLLFGLLFAITIIGIPFANQHFKLAKLAFSPFGKEIRD
ncbi:YccF domain-containing protein [Pontibacter sp. G13]|uniref:YccF domain-containing protein n=1 Tax=Pontibacter sp. G13 TaxID=3074898 RepID=UPI00288A75D0|nr:YccF domain-containing protein [Pontibacter sp. G13]WNJ18413.1 YccF domain-containing protein [Pontibacter sp. G13]